MVSQKQGKGMHCFGQNLTAERREPPFIRTGIKQKQYPSIVLLCALIRCVTYNINLKMVKSLSFLLVIALLLVRESALDWEGTGNMSRENMTVIKSYIQTNLTLSWTKSDLTSPSPFLLFDFAQAFSRELNRQWGQAWNVFVIYFTDKNNYDAVVYGYAFRDHWHWYNGIKFNDGYYASLILWKDYNCKKWWSYAQISAKIEVTYSQEDGGFFSSAIQPIYEAAVQQNVANTNVWQSAYNMGHAFETDSRTKDFAFTVLGVQSIYTLINGYFCSQDYIVAPALGGSVGSFWGRSVILQTR